MFEIFKVPPMLLLCRDLCSPLVPVAPLLEKISLCMNKREVREGEREREGREEERGGRGEGGERERERGCIYSSFG